MATPPTGATEPAARPHVPWGVLGTSLALVAATVLLAGAVVSARARLHAEVTTGEVVRSIERRMDMYVALLRGTAALFAADEEVDRSEFRRFVGRLMLSRYPGIQGIGITRRLRPGDAEAILAEARAAGLEEFHYWPEHDGERHAIVFLEPLDARNRAAMGFDMFSEPLRRAAMERARDEGSPAATGIVRLVQEIGPAEDVQPGFLVYAPIYEGGAIPPTLEERRAKLLGFSYAPFRARDLFEAIFDATSTGAELTIDDGESIDPSRRLFTLDRPGPHGDPWVRHIEIAGRPWTVEVRLPEELLSDARVVSLAVAFVGVLLTLFVVRSARARETALRARAEATAVLEREAQLRETFLGVLGHDLRNPLGAAKTNTDLLLRRHTLTEDQRRALDRVSRSIDRALRLVAQLLDVTRARLGGGIRIDARPLAIAPLVREVVEEARVAKGDGASVELVVDDGLVAVADPDRLAQILSNLTANALTHGEPPICVKARAEATSARIEVSNRGAPIPPHLLEVLFDPFKLGEATSGGQQTGLGLGLYISHQLALAHGGSLEVKSDESGTRFVLRLPLAPGHAARVSEGDSGGDSASPA